MQIVRHVVIQRTISSIYQYSTEYITHFHTTYYNLIPCFCYSYIIHSKDTVFKDNQCYTVGKLLIISLPDLHDGRCIDSISLGEKTFISNDCATQTKIFENCSIKSSTKRLRDVSRNLLYCKWITNWNPTFRSRNNTLSYYSLNLVVKF